MKPLILTARMDSQDQTHFNELRRQNFPPERNHLAAHLTLFHALPGQEIDTICSQLAGAASQLPVQNGEITGMRSLGHGVAFTIDCPLLITTRAALVSTWTSFLTPQDRQIWRPHITIQNKVHPDVAQALLQQLGREFVRRPIRFPGLDLWHYDGGPWDLAHSFLFNS